MRLINRILEKAVLPFALAAALGGASSFWTINSNAATCVAGNGITCTGECCNASATTCNAGPCTKPGPLLPPIGDEEY